MPSFKAEPPFLSGKSKITLHMTQLLIALIPALIALVFFFGSAVLIHIILAVIAALTAEAVMLKLRDRPLKPFLTDGSAVVTAVLFAMAIPPLTPWWLTVTGISFAIIFAKHIFGGLGYNPFNPAMIAYVLLLLSFPLEMTTWLPANELSAHPISLFDSIQLIFTGQLANGTTVDALSGATPLDVMKTQIGLSQLPDSILKEPLFGHFGGLAWEWINIWFALGGLLLIYRKIITWHIPFSMLAALLVISTILYFISPETSASPLFHLFSGGTMIGAFFIATDPVTSSTTLKGRIIFGAGVGLLTYIIRVWGVYPDAIAFAVLLMNMLVPLIDYYTQPKVYGVTK